MMQLPARFWAKVRKTDTCWFWTAATHNGYGRFSWTGGNRLAHVVSYEAAKGTVPVGLELHHKCETRNCVRPQHLIPVDHGTNVRLGRGGRRPAQACPQGHRYEGDNVYVRPDGKGRGCRICRAESVRKQRG